MILHVALCARRARGSPSNQARRLHQARRDFTTHDLSMVGTIPLALRSALTMGLVVPMNASTVKRLDDLFEESPMLVGEPVSEPEIDDAELRLGRRFPPDYRFFVRRYGGAMVRSLPVYGLRTSEVMGRDATVVEVTMRLRREQIEATGDWLVISGDGWGNPIGIANDDRVYLADHETGELLVVASCFEEYVVRLLDKTLFQA